MTKKGYFLCIAFVIIYRISTVCGQHSISDEREPKNSGVTDTKGKVLLPMYNDKPKDPGLNHQLSLHLVSIRNFQDTMFSTDYPMFVAQKKFGKKASLARQIRSDNQPQESSERELNDSETEEEMI